jgi:hypothetical protein
MAQLAIERIYIITNDIFNEFVLSNKKMLSPKNSKFDLYKKKYKHTNARTMGTHKTDVSIRRRYDSPL